MCDLLINPLLSFFFFLLESYILNTKLDALCLGYEPLLCNCSTLRSNRIFGLNHHGHVDCLSFSKVERLRERAQPRHEL
jgi:hypothetical protein